MIQKFLSKYALATHLALLVACPLVLTPFLSATTLGVVVLWLSAVALTWLFVEPSLRKGEHLSLARARVRDCVVRDPLMWLLVLLVGYAFVRYLNTGLALVYEEDAWALQPPAFPLLPASVKGAGFLPFCFSVACLVLVMGIRHGIGRLARLEFGLVISLVTGLSGWALVLVAAFGSNPTLHTWMVSPLWMSTDATSLNLLVQHLMEDVAQFAMLPGGWKAQGFHGFPAWASLYGVWLVIGLVSCIEAEVRRWSWARWALILGTAGNLAVLVLFGLPLWTFMWLAVSFVAVVWSLVFLSRVGSKGMVARTLSFVLLGVALACCLLMMSVPNRLLKMKEADLLCLLRPAAVESESEDDLAQEKTAEELQTAGVNMQAFLKQAHETYEASSVYLARVAHDEWKENPWFGSGLGAYGVMMPLILSHQEMEHEERQQVRRYVPVKPTCAANSYWTLLAERGIIGCALLFLVFAYVASFWVLRLIQGVQAIRADDESSGFWSSLSPLVWFAPLAASLVAVEAIFYPVFAVEASAFVLIVSWILSAMTFPKLKKAVEK